MPPPIALSKTKLMACLQCPRKLWLEQYNPELEELSDATESAIETGLVVGRKAREVYGRGGGIRIGGERGLRHAVERTAAEIAAGGSEPLFEATFDHEGLTIMTDVLERSEARPRLIEVKSSTRVKEHHYDDCAIQAWVMSELGHEPDTVVLAHLDSEFEYAGDGDYSGLFAEVDITDEIENRMARVPGLMELARTTLGSLDEPVREIGEHCRTPHPCAFIGHCTPRQGKYPVAGLGGPKSQIDEWINAGLDDLRDVPESDLASETQRRIWQQTREERPFLDPALARFADDLAYPRYFLDFETIAFAVPIWPGTRPYEALPFQWSCHVDRGKGRKLEHVEFLELSGNPPMRECANRLIDTLGDSGPILVYTSYEKTVIDALASRFPDLADALHELTARIVDLYPPTREHYYHPQMLGSWSIKSVLPTLPTGIDYRELGSVRDGAGAQAAFLEAIHENTSAERTGKLRKDLLDYCRYDTLALVQLVEFFSATASPG